MSRQMGMHNPGSMQPGKNFQAPREFFGMRTPAWKPLGGPTPQAAKPEITVSRPKGPPLAHLKLQAQMDKSVNESRKTHTPSPAPITQTPSAPKSPATTTVQG